MTNSALAASERRYLAEPDDACPRCGEDNGGGVGLCPVCSDAEHDAQEGAREDSLLGFPFRRGSAASAYAEVRATG